MNEAIENLKVAFINLGNALLDLVKKIVEYIWSFIKEHLPQIENEYFKKQAAIQNTRSSWYVPADTRRKSQVIDNKPKFVVRKVIR